MISLTSNRVEGRGEGTKIGFPTINFFIDELPTGLSTGLWAGITNWGQSISIISKYKKGYRIESNIIGSYYRIEINVGQSVTINFLSLLRAPIRITDVLQTIEDDKLLGVEFFKTTKTCFSCSLFYSKDYGYSNYTVEGTSHGCYADIFDDVEDISTLQYTALDCKQMMEGDSWSLDVDGENESPSEEWLKAVRRDIKLNKLLD